MSRAPNGTTAPGSFRTVRSARAHGCAWARLLVLTVMCALSACRFGYELLAAPTPGEGDAGPGGAEPDPDGFGPFPADGAVPLTGEGRDASSAVEDPPRTDGGPLADGGPVADGGDDASSPVVPPPVACGGDDPCSCGALGDHSYRFCLGPLNFAAAQADCAGHGMQLVRVDDAQEDAWLGQSFGNIFSGLTFAFIGASDEAQEGAWRWLVGDEVFWNGDSGGSAEPGFYTHWDVNKPFGNTTRNCAGILANGAWEDRSCTGLNAYVCESP